MTSVNSHTKICLIIGDPVQKSLSPVMHNAAYEALGISQQYIYLAANVRAQNLASAVAGIRALGIVGVSCTMPHKIQIISLLDEIDETARAIGAVNTVFRQGDLLVGTNTDWEGVIAPLNALLMQQRTTLKAKRIALLGAGGAARAACYGLTRQGAEVTIFNRSLEAREALSAVFSCPHAPIDSFLEHPPFQIIINATSVGMSPHHSNTPIPAKSIQAGQIVFDMVYHPLETALLKGAAQNGAHTIGGIEMLIHQGAAQFRLFTGKECPIEAMRAAIMQSLL